MHICSLLFNLRVKQFSLQYFEHSIICRSYDAHLIMQAIGQQMDAKLTCIPNNMEKYVSFSMDQMVFLDSFQFLPCSLEKLVANLTKQGHHKFKHTRNFMLKTFPHININTSMKVSHIELGPQ